MLQLAAGLSAQPVGFEVVQAAALHLTPLAQAEPPEQDTAQEQALSHRTSSEQALPEQLTVHGPFPQVILFVHALPEQATEQAPAPQKISSAHD